MSDMIERVGNEIYVALDKVIFDEPALTDIREWSRIAARAAIQAMREPTDAMQNAGFGRPHQFADGRLVGSGEWWEDRCPLTVWYDMIDEALK